MKGKKVILKSRGPERHVAMRYSQIPPSPIFDNDVRRTLYTSRNQMAISRLLRIDPFRRRVSREVSPSSSPECWISALLGEYLTSLQLPTLRFALYLHRVINKTRKEREREGRKEEDKMQSAERRTATLREVKSLRETDARYVE